MKGTYRTTNGKNTKHEQQIEYNNHEQLSIERWTTITTERNK